MVNGKRMAPAFINNTKVVSGKTSAEKIANINRVLTTCKRAGVPLLKKDGKGFKAYSTLIAQCNVKLSRESPSGSIFSEPKKNSLIANWRARRANNNNRVNDDFQRALNIFQYHVVKH